jgi:hypothetical protein
MLIKFLPLNRMICVMWYAHAQLRLKTIKLVTSFKSNVCQLLSQIVKEMAFKPFGENTILSTPTKGLNASDGASARKRPCISSLSLVKPKPRPAPIGPLVDDDKADSDTVGARSQPQLLLTTQIPKYIPPTNLTNCELVALPTIPTTASSTSLPTTLPTHRTRDCSTREGPLPCGGRRKDGGKRRRRVLKKRDARLCRDRHLDGAQAPHLMRWSVLEGIRDIIHSFAVQSRFTLLLGKSASARAGGRDFGA